MTKHQSVDSKKSLLLKTVKLSRFRLGDLASDKVGCLVAQAKATSVKTMDAVLNIKDGAQRKLSETAIASGAIMKARPVESFVIAAALGAVTALLVTNWLNRKNRNEE